MDTRDRRLFVNVATHSSVARQAARARSLIGASSQCSMGERVVAAPAPRAIAAAGIVLGRDYPVPIVDHAAARARTLERFGRALKKG